MIDEYFVMSLHFTTNIEITCNISASFPLKAYSGAIKSRSGLLASLVIDAAACNSFYKKIQMQISYFKNFLQPTLVYFSS